MLDDRRGVSNVLGFVLMFSLVVTTFAIYQADVVPHQNKQVEFEYVTEMEGELSHVKEALDGVAATGVESTVTVPGSPTYPKRAVGINAEPARGRFETTETYAVRLEGFETAGGYWNGDPRTYDTRLLRFDPAFNYYESDVSFYLENGVTVKRFGDGGVPSWRRGRVLSGNQLDVMLLGGQLSRSGRSIALPFRSVSSSAEYRTVTVDTTATVRVPTVRPESAWDQLEADNPNVADVAFTDVPGPVRYAEVTLNSGQYELRISKVTVEEPSSPSAEYVTMTPITAVTASNGQTFAVTTRDRYGNPVPDAQVDLSISGAGSLTTGQVTTDDDGHATFGVTNAEVGSTTVTARIDDGSPAYEEITKTVGGGAATDSSTFPVYASGQYQQGLRGVKSLYLSDGLMVPNSDSNCLLIGDAGGLLGGLLGSLNCADVSFQSIQGELAVDTNSGTFTVTYSAIDWNEDGDLTDDDSGPSCGIGCTMDDGVVTTIQNPDGDKEFQGRLTDAAAQDILDGGGETDVFENANYRSDGDSYDSIPSLSSAEDIFVRRATGRVTVTADDDN